VKGAANGRPRQRWEMIMNHKFDHDYVTFTSFAEKGLTVISLTPIVATDDVNVAETESSVTMRRHSIECSEYMK
jgi:hypothetical protein